MYLASAPVQKSNEQWTVELGLQNADGILGLDLTLGLDPSVVQIQSVTASGPASGFSVEPNADGKNYRIAVYGTAPMQGTGPILVVTYTLEHPVAGVPFTVGAQANENQIPVVLGPGLPGPATHDPRVTIEGQ